jgi:heme exporter protein A
VSVIDVSGLSFRVGSVEILRSIELTVEPGTCLGISGPNGSGKTTLLRVLATLLRPSAGNGEVLGARLGTDEVVTVRTMIGLAGHQPALYPELTLQENMEFVCRLRGLPLTTASQSLAMVGLAAAASLRAGRASFGMQRRADLARLFIGTPTILLLDEAHAGLDASAQPIVGALVSRTKANGGGAILVSHDPLTMVGVADFILPLAAGVVGAKT